ncbi:MAG: GNAT family N-acetyltransferase [Phormidesmis sp.]
MPFLACLPLIEPDIPAVLALDQRCLGGLWTRSGYQKELDSDHSDLLVLLSATHASTLHKRAEATATHALESNTPALKNAQIAAHDPNELDSNELDSNKLNSHSAISLLGIGCLWAILEEAHITTLAIEPAQQRQKLGQLLLSELLLHGHKRGLTRATLEVRVSNEKAFGLYQAFGFKEAGQRRRYYSDGENARVLWRSGLQESNFVTLIEQKKEAAIAQIAQSQTAQSQIDPSQTAQSQQSYLSL